MKLPQLAAVFLSLGVGIAGVMAVEASAERARVIAAPSDAKPQPSGSRPTAIG